MDEREELAALRRMAELEAKAGGGEPSTPVQAAAPQQDEGNVRGFGNYLRGIADAPSRIGQSLVEIGARGTDAVGLTDNAYGKAHQFFNEANDLASGGSKYYRGGALVGDVAATALPASAIKLPGLASKMPVVKALSRIGTGAAQGGAASAALSSQSDAPLLNQVAFGAAAGGALPTLGAITQGGKFGIKTLLGESTGAGRQSIENAYAAGRAGGDKSRAFTNSMRGNTQWDEVVTEAKAALGNMRAERGKAYREGMVDISKDRAVLDFKPLDDAMGSTSSVKNFKGIDTSPKTAQVRAEIAAEIDKWKKLDPAEYHTPEGFDALKQILGDIRDDIPFGTPQRKVADDAYNAVRGTIAKQAPTYDKVMKGYAEASDEIAKIEKELSLNPKANPNTALRKLQSVLRDNASTSWGNRAGMADRLAEAGAPNLLSSLSGQALSTPIPRGLAKFADAGVLALGVAHNPALALGALGASPRVVGEAAHLAGRGAGAGQGLLSRLPQMPPMPYGLLNPTLGSTIPALASGGR